MLTQHTLIIILCYDVFVYYNDVINYEYIIVCTSSYIIMTKVGIFSTSMVYINDKNTHHAHDIIIYHYLLCVCILII